MSDSVTVVATFFALPIAVFLLGLRRSLGARGLLVALCVSASVTLLLEVGRITRDSARGGLSMASAVLELSDVALPFCTAFLGTLGAALWRFRGHGGLGAHGR